MPEFFAVMENPLRRLARYAEEVRRDVGMAQVHVLLGFKQEFTDLAVAELTRLHTYLAQTYLDPRQPVPPVFQALLQRYVNQTTQLVNNAFSTAIDTVPELISKYRAKIAPGGPKRSILARVGAAVKGLPPEEPPLQGSGRELYGYVRGARAKARVVRITLLAYLRMLFRQIPRNYERDFRALLLRMQVPLGDEVLYRISPGIGPNSCDTCTELNGRVLTTDAMRYALTRLVPQLYHPNCVHKLSPVLITLATYDERKYGKLVTLAVLKKLIAQGRLQEGPARPSFVSV